MFLLGDAYRDDTADPVTTAWPVVHVGTRDLWVEGSTSPSYNSHLVVPEGEQFAPWQTAARMTLGDPHLRLRVFIEHNAPTPGHPATPGAGSGIFLQAGEPDGSWLPSGASPSRRTRCGRS